MATQYETGDYVLLSKRYNDSEGDEFRRGDTITLDNERDVKRALNAGAIAKPDSDAARKARMETTDDPSERARLQAQDLEAQAKKMLERAAALKGEPTEVSSEEEHDPGIASHPDAEPVVDPDEVDDEDDEDDEV